MLNLDLFPFEDLPLELQLMIFSYCTPQDRRDNFSFVSKSWAENLQSFTKDYQLYLDDCCLKEEIEPFSVLIKSTRQYRFLKLGRHVNFFYSELVLRLFSHLGKHIHVLEFPFNGFPFTIVDEFHTLMIFPKLKKLIVTRMCDLTNFDAFPESLEHIHFKELYVMEPTNELNHLKKIKNLRFWTADFTQIKLHADLLREPSTKIFCLDEKLKEILESMHTLENIYLKVNTNFIGTPVVQIDDVIRISFNGKPKKNLTFSNLPNLKSIEMYGFSKPPCFDNHEVNICPKVEELEIVCHSNVCIECFNTFIDSFPNLKKLAFFYGCCKTEQFNYICSKLPQLKYLKVYSSPIGDPILFNETSECSLGTLRELNTLKLPFSKIINIENCPFMPNLKKLNVAGLLNFSRTNLESFCEKLPNIECFEIEWKPDDDYFIEILSQHWKNLRELKLRYGFFSEKDYASLILNCKKLRVLEFHYCEYTPTRFDLLLFRDIPCLRRLREMGRKDYYRWLNILKLD